MPAHPLILHSWTGPLSWGLPAIDPDTVFVASLLQRTFLGRWTLSESNDPDASPNGQLPYLEHGSRRVASVPTIVAYLSTLSPSATLPTPLSAAESENGDRTEKSDSASLGKGEDLDKGLSKSQRAEMIAWRSVIQGELADLTTFTLYSSDQDYELLFKHLAESLPFPQAHYVPQRLRALHQARLEHVGLWAFRSTDDPTSTKSGWVPQSLGVMSTQRVPSPLEQASKKRKEATAGKFGAQRILDHSAATLSLLSIFLGSSDYFFNSSKPTTLDLYLFSQLSLILLPPFKQSIIANQIRTTYPNLQAHTLRILSSCFPPESPMVWPYRDAAGARVSMWQVARRSALALPEVGRALLGGVPKDRAPDNVEESKKEKAFRRKRWAWIAGVSVTFVTYLFASGLVQIGDDDEEDEYEEE